MFASAGCSSSPACSPFDPDPELGVSTLGCGEDVVPAPLATSSNPGGGSNSALDADAAYAIASAPYGRPKRAKLSRLEISLSWSGVGPPFGYVNSVFMSVCDNGDEMECKLIIDGDVRPSAPLRFCPDRVRESRLNIEPEPDCDGWWRRMRLRRWSPWTDTIDGPDPSRVCPLLLRGSGEAAGETCAGGAVETREARGLKMDANMDRRRPDCSVEVRVCVGGGEVGEVEMGAAAGGSFRTIASYGGASSV